MSVSTVLTCVIIRWYDMALIVQPKTDKLIWEFPIISLDLQIMRMNHRDIMNTLNQSFHLSFQVENVKVREWPDVPRCPLGGEESLKRLVIELHVKFQRAPKGYQWKWLSEIVHQSYWNGNINILAALTGASIIQWDKGGDLNELQLWNILIKLDFKLIRINKMPNSINGVIQKTNQRYFFKTSSNSEILAEISGYVTLRSGYPVSVLRYIVQTGTCLILIFAYEESIEANKGLLCDYMNKYDQAPDDDSSHFLSILFSIFKGNLENTIRRFTSPIDRFYAQRCETRLCSWYGIQNGNLLLEYTMVINGTHYHSSTLEIIEECIQHFRQQRLKTCFLSQGDPNDLNISLKPLFFDFATSGYNDIVGEFAVFFWDIYIACRYFWPKYFPEMYELHEDVFKFISEHTPNCTYTINHFNKEIDIKLEYTLSYIQKMMLRQYMSLFVEEDIKNEIDTYVRYYLLLRIFGVKNVTQMSEYDFIISLAFAHSFFHVKSCYLQFLMALISE